jgi:hypothetical protein
MSALASMKGGEVVVQTYIAQAISHAAQFKKSTLIHKLEELRAKHDPSSKRSEDEMMDAQS